MTEEKIAPSFYRDSEYRSYRQLSSHMWQVLCAFDFIDGEILEIGVGSGLTTSMLRCFGANIRTVDINAALNPDHVLSVLKLSDQFEPKCFDLAMCCEVLEHIPFADFDAGVREISQIARSALITLPSNRPWFGVGGLVKLPGKEIWSSFGIRLPITRRRVDENHFWEVWSSRETSLRRVKQSLKRHFRYVDGKAIPTNPHHIAFLCHNM